MVLQARGNAPEAHAALGQLCEAYWQPVFGFLRRQGRSRDESQELAQEFFTGILEGGRIDRVDPQKGRFRSYLLGALKHFLAERQRSASRHKRGGHVDIVSIQSAGTDSSPDMAIPDPDAKVSDASFDREWALAVMDRGLVAVQKSYEGSGKELQFELLKPWLIGETQRLSQADAATRLGMTAGALKVAIHRLRKAFREAIQAEITQTVHDSDDVDEELRYLIEVLA